MRVVTLILLVLVCGARGQVLMHQDFEAGVPGTSRSGWQHTWGQKDDDLLIISNVQAASGEQALLLNRAHNTAQWGAQKSLPAIDKGWLFLSVAFRVEGKGDRAHFGVELRNGNNRALALSFRFGRVSVATKLPAIPTERAGGGLGLFAEDRWYRVCLWLPSRALPKADGRARLERRTGDGWAAVGQDVRVACDLARKASPLAMLCLSPGRTGFRLYLDDLLCEKKSSPTSRTTKTE